MNDPLDNRRPQSRLEETPANRQVALLKLTPFLMGETPGPVMHAVFVDKPRYPNAAGGGTISYTDGTRSVLCWVNQQAWGAGQVVLAVNQGERYYAIGLMQ